MSRAAVVEIDFFELERQNAVMRSPLPPPEKRNPIRRIGRTMSMVNPQLLKTALAAVGAGATHGQPSSCSTTTVSPAVVAAAAAADASRCALPMLPVLDPASGYAPEENHTQIPRLTIFYNGTVNIFDLPSDKAEAVIRMMEEMGNNAGGLPVVAEEPADPLVSDGERHHQHFLDKLGGDLPIARNKSLLRFLEKRKERFTAVSPYTTTAASSSSREWELLGDNNSSHNKHLAKRQRKNSAGAW